MKVLSVAIKTEAVAKFMLENGILALCTTEALIANHIPGLIPTLVENSLQIIPLAEEPKVTRLELQEALMREKIFITTYRRRTFMEDTYDDVEREEGGMICFA